ncbi:MAG TPA: MBL fold metallo-hydrolase [Acidimicrobiales bacterium]|nr:MBL fold metallo-hydrolase [Acidimicrobiales bacterium]
MKLIVCGARGSTPAPGAEFARYGGHTSCVALAHDGDRPRLVLDAGTGLRRVTEVLGGEPFRGTVLLGHLHWDHTQGLPFFAAGDRPDAEVRLLFPEQGDPLEVLGRWMSPPHFPIRPDELRGAWSFAGLEPGRHRLEGFDVLAVDIPHKGGRTFGYRVDDGTATIAYLSDHHPSSLGPGPDGWGEYHPAALELVSGADLVLHDAQYTEAEFAAKASFGHSACDYAVELAARGGARRLLLFHHDPSRTDYELDAIGARWAQRRDPYVRVAAEGDIIDVRSGVPAAALRSE